MSKYLLEIGVEELPYKFIPMAISQLEAGFKNFLEANNVDYENIKVMATPRRLAVIISGLAASQPVFHHRCRSGSYHLPEPRHIPEVRLPVLSSVADHWTHP